MDETLIFRLKKRAEIRRSISTRKSVQEGANDRIADLLEEAAKELELAGILLDGSSITVELWEAKFPAQRKWKAKWLDDCRGLLKRLYKS